MTEVTRVPLQPIAKGSLTKLWLGVIVALLVAAGLAWAAVPTSTTVDVVSAGTGPMAKEGDVVFIEYTGKLTDGTVFDENRGQAVPVKGIFPDGVPFPLEEGGAIEGFLKGLRQTQKGGEYVFQIPAAEAYGANPPPQSTIPPNADLTFEVKVNDFMSREDFDRRLQALQSAMQAQQGAQGAAPGETPPTPPQN